MLLRSAVFVRGVIGVILVTGLLGCAGEREASRPAASTERERTGMPDEPSPGRDCLDAWNAGSNTANRERVAGAFPVAWVTVWDAEEDGSAEAGGASGQKLAGCSYVFHDDETSLEFSGSWSTDGLRWNQPQTGSWTAEQDLLVEDTAAVADDGTLILSPEP